MRPLLGLLLLVVGRSRADPSSTTVAPAVAAQPSSNCSLYCFITPERHERVNFTHYRDLSCTHFVYGIGHMTSYLQYQGPSSQDDPTHSYQGNFHYLTRVLRKGNPTAKILLGVHLNERDSLISYPPSRKQLADKLLLAARDLHVDGLFLRADRPFIDNSRFARFFEDLSKANKTLPAVLGVPLPILPHSITHVLEAAPHVHAVYLMSVPTLNKLVHVDPLLSSAETPLEQTLSYHVETLAAKGVPKSKIIVGLTAGAVVYKNYLVDSVRGEADGQVMALQDTCGSIGETALDRATASETTKSRHQWITSNAPTDESIGRKVRWLTASGYGGVGIQSLLHDDPLGDCGMKGPFPALRMAAENLMCTAEDNYGKGCTRLCYINSAKPLEKLQPEACSHVVVEATLTALGEVKLSAEGQATALWMRQWHVAKKPRLMISLGPRQTSDVWRVATSVQYYRKGLIKQLQELMTEWKATGVEVSWTLGGLDFPTDATNLEALMVEMRQTMDKSVMLALAVSHVSTYNGRYKDMKQLNKTVDFIVLHSHRFHSTLQPFTGHHSPLFYSSEILPDKKKNVEGLVAEWVMAHGVSRSMVVVGITAEPLSMMLAGEDRADNSPFSMLANPSVSNPLQRSTDEKKATNGKKVCELEHSNSSRITFIQELAVPFLVNNGQFVAYESERSVQMKTSWASLNHLGGVALFDVQLDNPEGECPSKPFPLLSTIANTQVCESCVRVDGFEPCDTTFTTSCSYRLPTKDEKSGMGSEKIPLDKCTQIVIEQALMKAWGEGGEIRFQDEVQEAAMQAMASSQAPKMGGKRLIASVRCNMDTDDFRHMIEHRGPKTVQNLLAFMNKYSLSGIELACDHMVTHLEKESFSRLVDGLREALIQSTPRKACPRSLSLRLPIFTRNLTETYDVAVLNAVRHVVLEPFNDPFTKSQSTTHINTPLFPANGHTTDIDTTLKAWAASGLEKRKVIILIPAYATLQDIVSNITEVGVTAENPRLIDQARVCSILKKAPLKKMLWDSVATYAVSEKREWMSMQDQATIAYKIFYATREGLGGIGLLTLNEDDWAGSCGSGQFPLLTAARARCNAQH